jgi:hypothetical protein
MCTPDVSDSESLQRVHPGRRTMLFCQGARLHAAVECMAMGTCRVAAWIRARRSGPAVVKGLGCISEVKGYNVVGDGCRQAGEQRLRFSLPVACSEPAAGHAWPCMLADPASSTAGMMRSPGRRAGAAHMAAPTHVVASGVGGWVQVDSYFSDVQLNSHGCWRARQFCTNRVVGGVVRASEAGAAGLGWRQQAPPAARRRLAHDAPLAACGPASRGGWRRW